jgi:hypothetical protein
MGINRVSVYFQFYGRESLKSDPTILSGNSTTLAKHETRYAAAAEKGVLVIEACGEVALGRAENYHQWQQMFFSRMRDAR